MLVFLWIWRLFCDCKKHLVQLSNWKMPPLSVLFCFLKTLTLLTWFSSYSQFFQLEVYNSDGSRMTESQIHGQLLRIRSQSWKTDKEPMGILTSEHRHTWGEAYNRLLRGRSHDHTRRPVLTTWLLSHCKLLLVSVILREQTKLTC